MSRSKLASAPWTVLTALPFLATSADAAGGLVYQGRAIFEEVHPAIVPTPFIGTWVNDRKFCNARATTGKQLVIAKTIIAGSRKMPVTRVLLNPRQSPDYSRAIVETRNGPTGQTLILQLDDKSGMTVTFRGQSGNARYVRCESSL